MVEKRVDINIFSSFQAWKMMKRIYLYCNNKNIYTYKSIATLLQVSRFDPTYNKLIKFLIDENIITIIEIKDRRQMLKIQTNKLIPLIEDSIWYEEIADYIRKTRVIYANI